MEEDYFGKHEISVEILHDPTIQGRVKREQTKAPALELNKEEFLGNKAGPGVAPVGPQAPKKTAPTKQKTKADFVNDLAALRNIKPEDVDSTLTINELKDLIKEAQNEKAGGGESGAGAGAE